MPESNRATHATTAIAAFRRIDQAAAVAEAMQAMVSGGPRATWLPGLAAVLDDVLPPDVIALERGLDEILREVEAIADRAAQALHGAADRDGLSPLALAAALIAATQLFLLNSRRLRAGGPALLFNGGTPSTWSWVLGTSTAARPNRPQP